MDNSRHIQIMLLDFYGELLTDKQRECFDLHVNEDLSLAEIAEQCGISRQGVWDNIRRAEKAMLAIEDKTGLIARYRSTRSSLMELRSLLTELRSCVSDSGSASCDRALEIVNCLLTEE